nr:O-antigen polymerase [uncultured Dethiosulfovibrio sp.]
MARRGHVIMYIFDLSLFIFFFYVSIFNPEKTIYIVIFTLFMLIKLCALWKSYQSVVLMFLFMSTFLVMFIPFFLFNIKISFYRDFQNHYYFSYVARAICLFIFTIWMSCFFKKNKAEDNRLISITKNLKTKPNLAITIIIVSTMIFIAIFGQGGENIFLSGGYGKGGGKKLLGGLAIFEYFLIFMPIFMAYSNRKNKSLIFLLSIFYVFKNLSLGGRIESLQVILMLFILFFDGKIPYKKVFASMIILMLFLNIWGVFRGNTSIGIKNALGTNVFAIYTLFDTQSEVIYTSSVYQSLRIDNRHDKIKLIKMFVLYIMSLIIPSRFMPPEAYLHITASKVTNFGGGGLISSYFFTWLGYPGVILVGIAFSLFLFSIQNKNKSRSLIIFQAMVLSSYPRWFSYSPITLFKMCVYAVIMWGIFKVVRSFFLVTIPSRSLSSGVCQ